jgi:hemin uptake protein HemP
MLSNDDTRAAAQASRPATAIPRQVSSIELLGREREVLIQHRGETYRLRLTRQDKLILTK